MPPPTLTADYITMAVFAAVLGALAGWFAAFFRVKGETLAKNQDFANAIRQLEQNTRAVEDIKRAVARRASLDSEGREAVRHFAAAASSIIHSMCWLTWDCKARQRVDSERVRAYDEEVHSFSPQIIGQLALVAMLDPGTHDKLAPLADEIFRLDVAVSEAIVESETNLARGLQLLGRHYVIAATFEITFTRTVTHLFPSESGQEAN
jgi:hypothetical protein